METQSRHHEADDGNGESKGLPPSGPQRVWRERQAGIQANKAANEQMREMKQDEVDQAVQQAVAERLRGKLRAGEPVADEDVIFAARKTEGEAPRLNPGREDRRRKR